MSCSKFDVDFTHVSVRNDVTFVHTLDHFLWGDGTEDAIDDAGVIHLVENESDHSPIFCNYVMPKVAPRVLMFLRSPENIRNLNPAGSRQAQKRRFLSNFHSQKS